MYLFTASKAMPLSIFGKIFIGMGMLLASYIIRFNGLIDERWKFQ